MIATATTSPTAPRPARPPAQQPAPRFQLAGRDVPQAIYYAAHEARRRGQRVFLVTAGPLTEGLQQPGAPNCPNCAGYGRLALETVIGGPFKDVPSGGERGTGEAKIYVSAVVKGKDWFQVTRDYFDCPACRKEIVL